ncbi:MAG: HD domain-containing protein [Candidatus Bathyarchaeia archaeon]
MSFQASSWGTPWGFIKDPIYGYIRITEAEKQVLDTRAVQRLRRVKQLAGVDYVYPAANHTRLEHSLGAMHLVASLLGGAPLQVTREEAQELRLAALLHDVGHGPFSHLSEPLLAKYLGRTHEDIGLWVITESKLAETLEREGLNPRRIAGLAMGRLEGEEERRFLSQVIRSAIDVDKMDFIVRDSYHTGAGYGSVDIFRLIYTMDVLEGNLAVDLTALPTLETFLLARVESFRAIYFHRTCRAVQIMIMKALEAGQEEFGFLDVESAEEYLALDDYTTWSMLRRSEKLRGLMDDIEARRLLKWAYDRTFFVEDRLVTSIITNESVRRRIEEEIAKDAGVEVDDVVIDTPSLPSVPYRHAIEVQPMDIPVFSRTAGGEKMPRRLTELSRIVDVLRSFMNSVRVYTKEPHREAVRKAAENILGKPSLPEMVSY